MGVAPSPKPRRPLPDEMEGWVADLEQDGYQSYDPVCAVKACGRAEYEAGGKHEGKIEHASLESFLHG